jgi:hypothetical protein
MAQPQSGSPHKLTEWVHRVLKIEAVWKNLTGPHRVLTSTPSDNFGMNWKADFEPGLITQPH